jgi:hypothetical protein
MGGLGIDNSTGREQKVGGYGGRHRLLCHEGKVAEDNHCRETLFDDQPRLVHCLKITGRVSVILPEHECRPTPWQHCTPQSTICLHRVVAPM